MYGRAVQGVRCSARFLQPELALFSYLRGIAALAIASRCCVVSSMMRSSRSSPLYPLQTKGSGRVERERCRRTVAGVRAVPLDEVAQARVHEAVAVHVNVVEGDALVAVALHGPLEFVAHPPEHPWNPH